MKLGDKWQTNPSFKETFHRFHIAVEAVIVAAIIWFVWTHWKNRKPLETP